LPPKAFRDNVCLFGVTENAFARVSSHIFPLSAYDEMLRRV